MSEIRAKITRAADIRPERQRWLARIDGQPLIPLGTGTIFAGIGGVGKSTEALDIVAGLTRGTLEGDLYGEPSNAIIFGPEDDWATVMVPRLIAAGADLDRVYQVQAETVIDEVTRQRELKFPLDIDLLQHAVTETGARLIMIDPAASMMAGTADMNRVQDVRRSFEPLMVMAQREDLSALMIAHFGKGAGNVGQKLSGSHAWRDLTRSLVVFAVDDETGDRVMTLDKSNYSASTGSWRFALDSVDVPVDGGTTSVGKVRHLGVSELSVGDIINRSAGPDDEDDRNAAQEFVLDFIKQGDQWEAKAADVLKAGISAGFSKDELKNARKRCRDPKIQSDKAAFGAGWVWRIEPAHNSSDSEGVTKVPKVSAPEGVTPSTPSSQKVTPSGKAGGGGHDPDDLDGDYAARLAKRREHVDIAHQHRAEIGSTKLTAEILNARTGWGIQHSASILNQILREERATA